MYMYDTQHIGTVCPFERSDQIPLQLYHTRFVLDIALYYYHRTTVLIIVVLYIHVYIYIIIYIMYM